MRIKSIVSTFLLALFFTLHGCDTPLFECSGTDFVNGGPLCYCVADGLLCGHSGFDSCLACPMP